MIRTFLLLGFLHLALLGFSQSTPTKIPAFHMVLPNGGNFSVDSLKKNKPVVIIYFAPDCGHCQALMKELFKRVSDFNKAEVVLITFKPLAELQPFVQQYNINQYPNIRVGTEVPIFYIRFYYNVTTTPFTALFNGKGKLVQSYRRETSVPDLVKRLKAIK
ncbi:MAG: TlpA family protein disulfide reductase [Flavisolibacter sp.]